MTGLGKERLESIPAWSRRKVKRKKITLTDDYYIAKTFSALICNEAMSQHADWLTLLEFLPPKHPLQVSLIRPQIREQKHEDGVRKKLNKSNMERGVKIKRLTSGTIPELKKGQKAVKKRWRACSDIGLTYQSWQLIWLLQWIHICQ